jgi:hypothetical protein
MEKKLHRWSIKNCLQTDEELKTYCRIENLEKAQAHSTPAQALHRQTAGLLLLLRHHGACSMDWKGTADKQYLQTLIVREQLARSSTIPPCFPALVSPTAAHYQTELNASLCVAIVRWRHGFVDSDDYSAERRRRRGRRRRKGEWEERMTTTTPASVFNVSPWLTSNNNHPLSLLLA